MHQCCTHTPVKEIRSDRHGLTSIKAESLYDSQKSGWVHARSHQSATLVLTPSCFWVNWWLIIFPFFRWPDLEASRCWSGLIEVKVAAAEAPENDHQGSSDLQYECFVWMAVRFTVLTTNTGPFPLTQELHNCLWGQEVFATAFSMPTIVLHQCLHDLPPSVLNPHFCFSLRVSGTCLPAWLLLFRFC